jgi:hypothetical protein
MVAINEILLPECTGEECVAITTFVRTVASTSAMPKTEHR